MGWQTPEAIWYEHRETTRGRDLDITGLSYAIYKHIERRQHHRSSQAAFADMPRQVVTVDKRSINTREN